MPNHKRNHLKSQIDFTKIIFSGIKSHARGHIRKAHAVVLVIRNPYDTFKANFNRIMAEKETGDGNGAHTGTIDPALFKSLKWRRYIHNTAEMWRQYYKDAVHLTVNSKKNFHFLWYDFFKTEKEEQMREVYAFLGNEAVQNGKFEVEGIDQRLNCIKNENLDNFKRKKVELDFDIYKPGKIGNFRFIFSKNIFCKKKTKSLLMN